MVPNNKFSLLIMSVLTGGLFLLGIMAFCYAAQAGIALVQINVGLPPNTAMPSKQAGLNTLSRCAEITALLFITGLTGSYFIRKQWRKITRLQTMGVKVIGTVDTIRFPWQRPLNNQDFVASRIISYEYTDSSGQAHSCQSVVSWLTAEKLIEGGPIPLGYDPERPADHMLDESILV